MKGVQDVTNVTTSLGAPQAPLPALSKWQLFWDNVIGWVVFRFLHGF